MQNKKKDGRCRFPARVDKSGHRPCHVTALITLYDEIRQRRGRPKSGGRVHRSGHQANTRASITITTPRSSFPPSVSPSRLCCCEETKSVLPTRTKQLIAMPQCPNCSKRLAVSPSALRAFYSLSYSHLCAIYRILPVFEDMSTPSKLSVLRPCRYECSRARPKT